MTDELPLNLTPQPQKTERLGAAVARPDRYRIIASSSGFETAARQLATDINGVIGRSVCDSDDSVAYRIVLQSEPGIPAEGYRLTVQTDGAVITASDSSGAFYGAQTLLQLLALHNGMLPRVEISDWPAYAVRELMVDMGRATFSLDLLRRVVRIMARLKLNSLHLHLYDDQLNSLRFDGLPLGSENPYALSLIDFRSLIEYSRQYHVKIVPEIEAWGHAGSILYHYPELYGAPGMWEGFSFGIGEELFALLKTMTEQIVDVMDDGGSFHFGLDEAKWALLPSVTEADKARYSPALLVERLHKILKDACARAGKQITMRCWADHGGRPIPADIADSVIVEPWMYFESREDDIIGKVKQYCGDGKPPVIFGAGMSSLHFSGSFGATRCWSQAGHGQPNARGVDICLWETNDIAGHLVGLFGGADYIWSPDTPGIESNDAFREKTTGLVTRRMKQWQTAFPDAEPVAIRADTGYEVYRGYYVEGPWRGRPVAPTCVLKDPRGDAGITQ